MALARASTALLAVTVCACAPEHRLMFVDESPPPPEAAAPLRLLAERPVILYLAFDGVTIEQAAAADATRDQSDLCPGVVPPFAHAPFGSDRAAVIDEVVAGVRALFADFALEVVGARPAAGSYQMLAIGGTPARCGRQPGIGGLSPLDCADAHPADVGYVFSDPITALDGLAVIIAHEAGHLFGLPHTMEDCDVMSLFFCFEGDKSFFAREMEIAPDHQGRCELSRADSHALLEHALGPAATVTPPDAGGCRLVASPFSPPLGGPLVLLFWALTRRKTKMGILDELSSATGNKYSNTELVKRCLLTPALLHSVAEGLRTGTPQAKVDCVQVLVEVAKRRAELLANFVNDFVDATRAGQKKGGSRKVAKLGFDGLNLITRVSAGDVFAERDYLFETARGGGPLAVDAAGVLATLCNHNANYRGKLLGHVIRLLASVPPKDFPKWLTAITPAVEGSVDGIKRLELAIGAQREQLAEPARKKVDKLMVKLERTTIKKK